MPRLNIDHLNPNFFRSTLEHEERNPFIILERDSTQQQVRLTLTQNAPDVYRVAIRSRTAAPSTYSFDLHRYDVAAHAAGLHTAAVDRMLHEGRELVVEWDASHHSWTILPIEYTGDNLPPSPQTERSEADSRLIARLRRETREAKAETVIMRQRAERAELELATAQRTASHAESVLADLDRLRTTAVIWRDARNGTRAKLRAFTDFCEALDSLPVPQDA